MSPDAKSRWAPLLALALLLALGAVAIGLTVVPVWRLAQGYDRAIADLERRLSVQHGIAAGAEGLQSRLKEIESGFARDAHYLKSTTQTLAAAEIQEMVKRTVLSARGEVLSTQIVGVEPERAAQRVTLKLALRAQLEQLVKILHALETGDPYLFIDSAGIRARTAPLYGRAATTPASAVALDVQLQLSGYFTQGPK